MPCGITTSPGTISSSPLPRWACSSTMPSSRKGSSRWPTASAPPRSFWASLASCCWWSCAAAPPAFRSSWSWGCSPSTAPGGSPIITPRPPCAISSTTCSITSIAVSSPPPSPSAPPLSCCLSSSAPSWRKPASAPSLSIWPIPSRVPAWAVPPRSPLSPALWRECIPAPPSPIPSAAAASPSPP